MTRSKEATIDKLFEDFSQPDAPGAVLGIIKESKLIAARAWGLANVETRAPCGVNTNFRLASVTKQFTAMCVLILRQEAKLSLNREISSFLPALATCAAGVTVRHLLTHSSGLPDYEDFILPGVTGQVKDQDILELIATRRAAYFEAGARFRYSNTGYALLALMVEAVSGCGFASFLRTRIFEPAGMTNTVAYEAGISTVPHRALGYTERENGFQETDQSQTSAVLGDGGIYSSLADLARWDQSLYTERLVPAAILQEAFSPAAQPTDVKGSAYGFGWYVDHGPGAEPHHWHNGSTCGFSARIERFPAKRLSVIILINRSGVEMTELGRKVLAATTEWFE